MRESVLRGSQQKGMVLIALLWILVALSLLALNLSSTVRTEASVAAASGEAEKAYFFARGGLEAVIHRLVYPERDPEKQKRLFRYRDGMNHFWINSREDYCHVAVQDEAGKIDLNFASEVMLDRILQNVGVSEALSSDLAEAIVKWRQPDTASKSEARKQDAEKSAFKQRPFSSVEELLLIRGMNREILYGSVRKDDTGKATVHRGLADFVTVYSAKLQINLNYAEPEVVAAIPGIGMDLAHEIVTARMEEGITSGSQLAQRVAGWIPGEALSLITTEPSNVYSLVATAFTKDSRARRSIRAVVKLDQAFKWGHDKLVWYDEYWPSDRILAWTEVSRLPEEPSLKISKN
jgi:general secretion pathway protein K